MYGVHYFPRADGKKIYCFSNGKVKLCSDVIDEAGRNAIKAILASLPEGKKSHEIMKYVLENAIDLLNEQQVVL